MERRFQYQVIACLFLMPFLLFFPYFIRDSPIKQTAYSIRFSVLQELPLRSSKAKAIEYLRGKKWRNYTFGQGPLGLDPARETDILIFNKEGTVQSNYYYNFKKESQFIKVDLGWYLDLRKSWKFLTRVQVSLFLLFQNEELVQVRAIKIST